jgi:hypothetical protein
VALLTHAFITSSSSSTIRVDDLLATLEGASREGLTSEKAKVWKHIFVPILFISFLFFVICSGLCDLVYRTWDITHPIYFSSQATNRAPFFGICSSNRISLDRRIATQFSKHLGIASPVWAELAAQQAR